MKLILCTLTVVTLILLINSCKKGNIDNTRFYSVWEKRSEIGFGVPFTTYSPGNGIYLELKRDGVLNQYNGGAVIFSTSYKITKKRVEGCNWPGNKEYIALEYENGSYDEIAIKNDTLVISTPPCWNDGGASTYVRINK